MNSSKSDYLPRTSSKLVQETIVQAFDEQVARTPGAIAVVGTGQELTYRHLGDKVNQLSHHLQKMGVAGETLVAIFMERSLDMIVALVATLKAGAAYVPLDPAYPADRIALMIADSRATVLSTARMAQRLPAAAKRVLALDSEAAAIEDRTADSLPCPATGASLAYVIYTSGSSGKPKGVMVEHRNVCSFFSAMDCVLGTEPGVWLAVTSISFDISVLELLWTLTRGFKVVLHGEEGTHTIGAEIIRHGVTHFQSTPSLARMLVADPNSLAALGTVQKLLLGGEALPATLLGTLRRATRGAIYNMYGPSETTVWSTMYRIPEAVEFRGTVPIGQPLANTRAYVLDAQLERLPDGESGELCLGGDGVARGYWERPKLTAERSRPDPFEAGGRIYCTGDVVRRLPDGNLEFLGRIDSQIKLRGHRIELGEIEAVLEQVAAVRQAVVVAREDRPTDKRLVAYVVPSSGVASKPAALRAALASKLPAYMVPSQFVFVDRLPLTPNGKIDRQALPAPRSQSVDEEPAQSSDDRPCREMEGILVRIWAEALGVAQVAMDENIFDLGATSLMMPEVQMELQRRLGREVSLIDLFEFHTVKTLAAHLTGHPVAVLASDRGQRRRAARMQEGPP